MTTEPRSLKPLSGTEKQIAWANEIRDQLIPEIDAVATRAMVTCHERGDSDLADAIDAARVKAISQTSAGWWIDRKPKSDIKMCAQARITDFLGDLPEDRRDAACDIIDEWEA